MPCWRKSCACTCLSTLMIRRNVISSGSLRYTFFLHTETLFTENAHSGRYGRTSCTLDFYGTLPGSFIAEQMENLTLLPTDKLDVISVYLIYAKHLYPMDVIPLRCYLTYRPIWNAVADNAIETRGPWCAINRSRELKRCTRSTGTEPYISWKLLIIPLLQSGQVGRARCTCADSFRPMPKRGSATCGSALFNVLRGD